MNTEKKMTEEDIAEQPILELSATTQLSDYVSAIAWSPTGNILAAATCNGEVHLLDRKSTRLNSSHRNTSRMPSSA